MIKLDENWYITSDSNSFNLVQKTLGKQKNENGEEVEVEKYIAQSYHGSIQSAVTRYIKLKQMERVSTKEYKNLQEAVEDLKAMQKEIENKLKI